MIDPGHTVGIIGAGIAGLACASRLRRSGATLRLIDKGRSPGGRVATRRVHTGAGSAHFDHGAQFFTARHPEFREAIANLPAEASMPWHGVSVGDDWRVATPGMSVLPRALADGLDISPSTRVDAIVRNGGRWTLIGEDAAIIDSFDVGV